MPFSDLGKAVSYDPKRAAFTTWMANIARYKAIDLKRKYLRERAQQLPLEEDMVGSEHSGIDLELLEQETEKELRALLQELSPENQIICHRYVLEEVPVAEISREYHLSPAAIYNRVSRSRALLRKKMERTQIE